jgi:uncharacterized membrane protein
MKHDRGLTRSLLDAKNVAAIKRVHDEGERRRSWTEHLGCMITSHSGRFWVVLVHVAWFALWILLNTGVIGRWRPFDPFPFTFLTLVVSLEAIFLTFFVLMGQNAQSLQTDRLARLDLQINMLAEQEMTEALRMLRELCKKQGLHPSNHATVEAMARETSIESLARALDEADFDHEGPRRRRAERDAVLAAKEGVLPRRTSPPPSTKPRRPERTRPAPA